MYLFPFHQVNLFCFQDRKGDLLIHAYVDEIMEELFQLLSLDIPDYCKEKDLTLQAKECIVEWTISTKIMGSTRKLHAQLPKPAVKKRKSTSELPENKKTKAEDTDVQIKLPGKSEIIERSDLVPKVELNIDQGDNSVTCVNDNSDLSTTSDKETCPQEFELKTES